MAVARRAWAPVLAGLISACTSVSSRYEGEITRPSAASVMVCHGFDCRNQTRVVLSAADSGRFATIMAAGAGSAAAERAAIGRAVEFYEKRAVEAIGASDHAKSDVTQTGQTGQMDCIDESTNTRTLLLYLSGAGLLKHHRVERNVSRGILLDARYPHSTAVLTEVATGTKWAVDSWYGASGEAPDIMKLSQWLTRGVVGAR